MRLYYALPLAGGFIVIVSYLTGGNIYPVYDKLVLSFLSLVNIISAGYILNDVCDVEVDRINCPDRVMPKGQISKKAATICAITLFLIGLMLAGFCNIWFLLLEAVTVAGLIFYDIYSKRIGIFKDILAAALVTSLYPLAFALTQAAQTSRLKSLFISPVWLFLTALGYEMLKDIRDAEGDYKIRSIFAIEHKLLFPVSRVIIIAAAIIIFLPFILGYCGYIYFIAAIIAFVLAVFASMNKPTAAIRYIYLEVFIIALGSMMDLLVFGP